MADMADESFEGAGRGQDKDPQGSIPFDPSQLDSVWNAHIPIDPSQPLMAEAIEVQSYGAMCVAATVLQALQDNADRILFQFKVSGEVELHYRIDKQWYMMVPPNKEVTGEVRDELERKFPATLKGYGPEYAPSEVDFLDSDDVLTRVVLEVTPLKFKGQPETYLIEVGEAQPVSQSAEAASLDTSSI